MNLVGYKAFLTLGYWFNIRPVPMPRSWLIGLDIFFGIFILGGIVAAVLSKKKDVHLTKRLLKFSRLGWAIGLLGFLWLFFSYEQAVVLGSRFWFLILLLAAATRLFFLVKDLIKNLPRERAAMVERERFLKYLPKKKK